MRYGTHTVDMSQHEWRHGIPSTGTAYPQQAWQYVVREGHMAGETGQGGPHRGGGLGRDGYRASPQYGGFTGNLHGFDRALRCIAMQCTPDSLHICASKKCCLRSCSFSEERANRPFSNTAVPPTDAVIASASLVPVRNSSGVSA